MGARAMTKRKKWTPSRFTGLTYTGGKWPPPAPRRKRVENKGKAAPGKTQSGHVDPMNHH